MNLKGRNFLKLMDFSPEEITYLIDLSAELKEKKKQGIFHDSLPSAFLSMKQDEKIFDGLHKFVFSSIP